MYRLTQTEFRKGSLSSGATTLVIMRAHALVEPAIIVPLAQEVNCVKFAFHRAHQGPQIHLITKRTVHGVTTPSVAVLPTGSIQSLISSPSRYDGARTCAPLTHGGDCPPFRNVHSNWPIFPIPVVSSYRRCYLSVTPRQLYPSVRPSHWNVIRLASRARLTWPKKASVYSSD